MFVNSFSFREMEPEVVESCIDEVCAKGTAYDVSVNFKLATVKAQKPGEWGSLQPVT